MAVHFKVVHEAHDAIREAYLKTSALLVALEKDSNHSLVADDLMELDGDLRVLLDNLQKIQPYIQQAYSA